MKDRALQTGITPAGMLMNCQIQLTRHISFTPYERLNALVIFNHGPPPLGRAGDSRGSERGFNKSFATAVLGKYLGFALYRQKRP